MTPEKRKEYSANELKRYHRHKKEINAKRRQDRKTNPKIRLNAKIIELKRKYNITLEDYNYLLTLQNGVCAICKQNVEKRELAVDHNHTTGKIRGLLCTKCNSGLGLFREDPKLLLASIDYLERYNNVNFYSKSL